MPLTILNGPIIQAGESLSAGIDCSAGPIVKITMPGNFVGDTITFQTSVATASCSTTFSSLTAPS